MAPKATVFAPVALPVVRRALGLDDAPIRVPVLDHNVDEWPNAALTPVLGRPEAWSYGFTSRPTIVA